MPAETHQLGSRVDTEHVLTLLYALLGDLPCDQAEGTTLAALGIDPEGLYDLWDAICEEFGERSLGPELDPGVLDVSLTIEAAAAAMASLFGVRDDHGG